MRLSEIKGERTAEVIADILDPIEDIASDPEAAELFYNRACPEGEDPTAFVRRRMKKAMPKLLREHKDSIFTIMAAINGVPEKEYRDNVTVASLIIEGCEVLTDPIFRQFFTLAQTGEVTSSGAAPENTEGRL